MEAIRRAGGFTRVPTAGMKLQASEKAITCRRIPLRDAGAVTTGFPLRILFRAATNTSTQRTQTTASSVSAIVETTPLNDIRERLPQFIKPGVSQEEDRR